MLIAGFVKSTIMTYFKSVFFRNCNMQMRFWRLSWKLLKSHVDVNITCNGIFSVLLGTPEHTGCLNDLLVASMTYCWPQWLIGGLSNLLVGSATYRDPRPPTETLGELLGPSASYWGPKKATGGFSALVGAQRPIGGLSNLQSPGQPQRASWPFQT